MVQTEKKKTHIEGTLHGRTNKSRKPTEITKNWNVSEKLRFQAQSKIREKQRRLRLFFFFFFLSFVRKNITEH